LTTKSLRNWISVNNPTDRDMKKKEYDHFIGLWKHKVHGHEIKYQKDGKQKSEFRKDEREAQLRADYWKVTLEHPAPGSEQEHPVLFWERMLRQAAELLLKNPTDQDIANACRTVAAMATASMRAAKYIPAPVMDTEDEDGAVSSTGVTGMSTEQMEAALGNTNKAS